MSSFRLSLDLGHHCIATAIKRRYNQVLSDCFRTKPEHDTPEHEIELLKLALETLDFPAMRSKYPELNGNTSVPVILGRNGDRLFLLINENQVELLYSERP